MWGRHRCGVWVGVWGCRGNAPVLTRRDTALPCPLILLVANKFTIALISKTQTSCHIFCFNADFYEINSVFKLPKKSDRGEFQFCKKARHFIFEAGGIGYTELCNKPKYSPLLPCSRGRHGGTAPTASPAPFSPPGRG